MLRSSKVRTGGVLLGIGMGALLYGIVLRQIVHWHQMLSAVVPPIGVEAMRLNMAADGWFNLAAWAVVLAGVFVLWSGIRGPGRLPTTRTVCGYLLIGWGSFNLAEGFVGRVFGLHHVRDLPVHIAFYDWVLLLVGGVGFIVFGLALRDGRHRVTAVEERRSGRERRTAFS